MKDNFLKVLCRGNMVLSMYFYVLVFGHDAKKTWELLNYMEQYEKTQVVSPGSISVYRII